jgi:2,3-bisphosphoglycerate-independent phosphoglycerate mutase
MVGHTGVREAIEKAIAAVDDCMGQVVDAARANDYEIIIIADHGNADNAENEDGSPNTAHSLNPVPIVYVTDRPGATVEHGILADVSPTICQILGIEKPAQMTGRGLLKF